MCVCVCVCLVMSDSLQPHGLEPIRLLCPCDFPVKKTGVGCHYLLQGIFPSQGSNLCLLHGPTDSSSLSRLGSPSFSILLHIPHILNHCLNVIVLTLSPPVLSSSGCSGLLLPTQFTSVFLCPLEFHSLNCKEK